MLALVCLGPACGGGGSGGGGSLAPATPPPIVPISVFRADLEQANVVELYAVDGTGALVKLSGTLMANGDVRSFSWSPDRKWVAFAADKDSPRVELYVVPATGGSAVKVHSLPNPQGDIVDYAWAPDSSRIAYRASLVTPGRLEVYSAVPHDPASHVRVSGPMNPNGSVFAPVGPSFAWAPDGSRIAYIADQDTFTVQELYTSLPTGLGNVKVSATGGQDVSKLGWSPDSTRLAYSSPGGGGLFTLHTTVPTTVAQDVTVASDMVNNVFVDWAFAPNSSRIAYRRDMAGVWRLHTALLDGTGVVEVSGPMTLNGDVADFFWATNSQRIAYRANQVTSTLIELFTSPADTAVSNVKVSGPMVAGGGISTPVTWAPDSSRIAYIAVQNTSGRKDLYTSPAATAVGNICVSEINPSGSDVQDFAWAPDGSRIAYRGGLLDFNYTELFTAPPAGSGQARVSGPLTSNGDAFQYQWRSDSSRLIYSADQDTDMLLELFSSAPATAVGNLKLSGFRVPNGSTMEFAVR